MPFFFKKHDKRKCLLSFKGVNWIEKKFNVDAFGESGVGFCRLNMCFIASKWMRPDLNG